VTDASPLTLECHLGPDAMRLALEADVRAGLTATPKTLPPKWFYDARGSELFDEITRLPGYYPTRCERAVLAQRSAEIAELTGADTLVELGSGTSDKTRLLLDALHDAGTLRRFVPFDVDESVLTMAGKLIGAEYPELQVHAVVGDFEQHLPLLPTGGRRLVAFLGGTIGNLLPDERSPLLSTLASTMVRGDFLLLGTDLVKDPQRLVAAYDDPQGVTANFNKNVLRVVNRELDGDVDVDAFAHVAVWDPEQEWIEMRLQSLRAQTVRFGALGLSVDFAEGEQVRTEISAKFREQRVRDEMSAAGLELRHWWTDDAGDFGVSLSVRA
jgi:L-histidine N-alpha-methyltransferase